MVDGNGAEAARLATSTADDAGPWLQWGPYLAERAWGTVREDYSASGDAWASFPHDHARSRSYRWSEDGLAGISDIGQHLCFALALWNGRDAILKERIFGLSGHEGNHGEDAKEYWWYLDSTPTHSWMRWRYHYPQRAFPYDELVTANGERSRHDPEFELLDTAIFDDDRYWRVTVDYAKAAPDDICVRIEITNMGTAPDVLHVLPTLWFRNTWSWGERFGGPHARPRLCGVDGAIEAGAHGALGPMTLTLGPNPLDPNARGPGAAGSAPTILVCENETNYERVFGVVPDPTQFPKDAINDTVIGGTDRTNPDRTGTKAAAHYVLEVPGGASVELRARLAPGRGPSDVGPPFVSDLGADFDTTMATRANEADAFYAALTPKDATVDEARVLRQGCAGMLWGKQLYHADVERWLDGDPAQPSPPAGRDAIRNGRWRHLNAFDVMSMPDTWEYPWFAAWDLAFQAVALAHLDPSFAKHQLVLLCREWFMHPNGQLPSYEWDFSAVNPPVHAWAALRVFEIDGSRDHAFLERIFQKLLINFTWWVNRTDAQGDNVFEGGFLGLDNVGPFDRSKVTGGVGELEQSDGTAWMAVYCLNLLEMALILAVHDPVYEDVATKFFEHFAYISTAMRASGMWDDADGFYYDVLRCPDGSNMPIKARSVVGLIALFAVSVIDLGVLDRLEGFRARVEWFVRHKPQYCGSVSHIDKLVGTSPTATPGAGPLLLSVVDAPQLRRILTRLCDPEEFLSPHGVRALSRYHREHPLRFTIGGVTTQLDYEPGASTTALFGGNSNWRGPVWLPINVLCVESLRRFHRGLGDDFTVEHPVGAGTPPQHLGAVADDLTRRVLGLFLDDTSGRRPVFGDVEKLQRDPAWHDQLLYFEYFHGDTGAGLGASHQTGWTGLIIDLMLRSASTIAAADARSNEPV